MLDPVAVVVALGFGDADRDHLRGVIPLVDRRRDVEPLVALQPDQPAPERRRQHLGDLGLADAGLAFEEQRPAHAQRQEQHRRQRAVGEVIRRRQELERLVDGRGQRPGGNWLHRGHVYRVWNRWATANGAQGRLLAADAWTRCARLWCIVNVGSANPFVTSTEAVQISSQYAEQLPETTVRPAACQQCAHPLARRSAGPCASASNSGRRGCCFPCRRRSRCACRAGHRWWSMTAHCIRRCSSCWRSAISGVAHRSRSSRSTRRARTSATTPRPSPAGRSRSAPSPTSPSRPPTARSPRATTRRRAAARGRCWSTTTAAASCSATSTATTACAGASAAMPTCMCSRSTTGSRPSTGSPPPSMTRSLPSAGPARMRRNSAPSPTALRSAATAPAATSRRWCRRRRWRRAAPRHARRCCSIRRSTAPSSGRSLELFREGYLIGRADIAWYHLQYTGSAVAQPDPAQNPLVAKDFAGLAPALIVTAGFDPLRDEGEAYADALRQAGVPVVLKRFERDAARLLQHGDDQPGLRRGRQRDHRGAAHADRPPVGCLAYGKGNSMSNARFPDRAANTNWKALASISIQTSDTCLSVGLGCL